jgi:dethiobiotin synthetase
MKLFVTGIGTDVGKQSPSSIITESLQWPQPIQAGDLDNSDSHKIQRYISNDKTVIHPNSYKLNTPASPH